MNFGNIDPAKVGGLYEAMMGGARPRVGTPPFAPPFPQTGGANAPTTPETAPVKRGLAGFMDRMFNPTNGLGQFGQALLASSGGPLGNAIGYMIQQRAATGKRDAAFEDWKRQYDYERGNPKPSTAQPYRWEANDGDVYELGAAGPQRLFDDPSPKMNFIPDGMGGGKWVALPSGTVAPEAVGAPELPPGYTVRKKGGGAGNGTGGFPRVG